MAWNCDVCLQPAPINLRRVLWPELMQEDVRDACLQCERRLDEAARKAKVIAVSAAVKAAVADEIHKIRQEGAP